ncbi:hemolysin family protein [Curvibacter sp. APW13]|uniref:hemolysin family protein n=1 Tax=Curvibacter sp. APW13 TaxID=3077236 RepID=UPI0028DF3B51|nr:hemolysin family protein [Curvibacter sp. APW13]MDT8991120.1 hemolysin family protein [Curvibacter sp. APW13]
MDFLLILVLTVLNGLFAMSELALTASKRIHLQNMQDAGDKGARAALVLLDNPTQFLSVVQVGITSIGMLNAIVGEAAFSEGLAQWLKGTVHLSDRVAEVTATGLVVTCITFLTILLGELVPKRIGQLYPEQVASLLARPMTWVARLARPFVRLLSYSTHGILRLLRIDTTDSRGVTEAEISASLEEGVDAGIIEEHEHQMVRNVFHLDDRTLTSMMQPRSEIQWVDATATVAQTLESLGQGREHHSWYPVCRGSLEQVVGMISVARLLELGTTAQGGIEDWAEPAVFVPETLNGMELIEHFRAKAARMVFVVDEYGDLQGLLTPFDLLQAITGELKPTVAADAWAQKEDNGGWLLDGAMPVEEMKHRLDIDVELPLEQRYSTVAGLLMAVSGRLLAVGERVQCAGWEFEVATVQGMRLDSIRATPRAQQPPAAT